MPEGQPSRVLKNSRRGGSLLKKAAGSRRAQATAEAYDGYTPHKETPRATQQMPLFQQTAGRSGSTCVVIPAYQARSTIGVLVKEIAALGFPILVVDDASSDGTGLEACQAGAEVIHRSVNGGKGVAMREGITATLQKDFSSIVTLDADGQHLPREIPLFLQAARETQADLVIGNRMAQPREMPLDRWLTNWLLSRLLSCVVGQGIQDTQSGFRWMSTRMLRSFSLESNHFEVESELLVRAARGGFRIVSVPISSVYRKEPSFIRPILDAARFLRFLYRVLFRWGRGKPR